MLAIAGGKGGTGKTTTALALARELAVAPGDARRPALRSGDGARSRARGPRDGRAVLVVDADVDMPDLHAMAGVEREPTFLDDSTGQSVPELPGVSVAPAPPPDATTAFRERLQTLEGGPQLDGRNTAGAPAERTPVAASDERTSVDGVAGDRGSVLVDAPCGAGPDAALALDAAAGVVLVTRPTPAAVRDTAKTAAMARAVGTPPVAAVVVGPTPSRSLAPVFDVERVVSVPFVDGDPLASPDLARTVRELGDVISTWETPF